MAFLERAFNISSAVEGRLGGASLLCIVVRNEELFIP